MDEEEETTETEEQKTTTESAKDRNKREKTETIKQANDAAERLEKANEKHEELLETQKEQDALKALGGNAEAGQPAPEKKKLTDEEYADQVSKGLANPLKDDGFVS